MSKMSHSYPNRKTILDRLDALSIAHKTYDHPPVFTVAESADVKAQIDGAHTKNLFVKEKSNASSEGQYYLICAKSDTEVPMKSLHRTLGCRRLSFGKADELEEFLGVTPGSVTLLAIANDAQGRVKLVIDRALVDSDLVNFHPMKNDATTQISSVDMLRFAKSHDHDPLVLDFARLTAQ